MIISKMWTRLALVAVSIVLHDVVPVAAAEYPTRPVTLVVAFTPGGPSDVLARIVGKKMERNPRPAVRDREPARRRRQHRRRAVAHARPTATRC